MNIKKRIPKFLSLLLCFSMTFGNMISAYAMENTSDNSTTVIDGENISTEERNLEDITVTYKQASSFFVTIPKTIVLDGWKQSTYSVKVSGDIGSEQCVYVAPIDMIDKTENIDFYMKDQASENAKDDVMATVTHNKFHWNSAEVAAGHKQADNLVEAPDLTAGAWKGIFQMEIKLETKKAHEHNYVDGKCECGAIDPNHTHNYGEDGNCTICGKEQDPYETAPASAYSNWNYTLDNTSNIITLNYYKGSETDVIVYANYVINGKIYKTQLASNADNAHYQITKYMFNGYALESNQNIRSIKFSEGIDTSNVTNMDNMFYYCKSLASLEISGFNTSNVTTMQRMFAGCSSLEDLDVSHFDTSKVTNMYSMFNNVKCKNIDLSNFDTSNVTNMGGMFYYCNSTISIDVSSFDTSKVTDMNMMFSQCQALTSLDLSNFDTKNVTNMNSMFSYCSALNSIYVTEGKWITSQATTAFMLLNCGTSTVTYK